MLASCAPRQGAGTPESFPVKTGEYFGQEPPGLVAELFAPGVVSTGLGELNAAFFPGGTRTNENCPLLSPCGRYLFFTSRVSRHQDATAPVSYDDLLAGWSEPQNGQGDVYWIDAEIIETLRAGT